VNETFQDNPVTIFGIHKLMAEKYLQYYSREFGMQTVTLRLSNVYGPTSRRDRAVQVVLNKIIYNASLKGKITIFGDGTFIRDYVFVEDVINSFLTAGINMDTVNTKHYYIGNGIGHRLVDAVNLIADRVALKKGQRPIIEYIPPPLGLSAFDKRNFVSDTARFHMDTGWSPNVPLEEGVDRTINYFIKNS
jgi:nucleoside-diphosphate-sugar epimerase